MLKKCVRPIVAKRVARRRCHRAPSWLSLLDLSGSGKATVLKAFEDLGYYAVDNMPIELIPKFAELAKDSSHVRRAALVIDIREGEQLAQFPEIFQRLKKRTPATLVFLEAGDRTLARRFSETRRPHPLGTEATVLKSLRTERELLAPIRSVADHIIDTSKFNVHELREVIGEKFSGGRNESSLRIDITSFGYRHGVRRTAIWCSMSVSCRIPITFPNSRTSPAGTPAWRATFDLFRRPRSLSIASQSCSFI